GRGGAPAAPARPTGARCPARSRPGPRPGPARPARCWWGPSPAPPRCRSTAPRAGPARGAAPPHAAAAGPGRGSRGSRGAGNRRSCALYTAPAPAYREPRDTGTARCYVRASEVTRRMHVAEVESDVNHSSPWDVLLRTWEELDLPDGWRAEISQGGVLLLPPPGDDHNDIVETVQRNLYQQILLSSGEVSRFRVHQTADLRVLPLGTLFVPDLLVLPGPLRERGAEHSAADALLVVEVASPGN